MERKVFGIRVYYRLDGQLEQVWREGEYPSLAAARTAGKVLAAEYQGRLVSVDRLAPEDQAAKGGA